MASKAKYLVSDILTIIADLRGETTTDVSTRRIRAVSRAESDFAKRKFWATHLLADQSMSGDDTSNYTVGSATYPMRLNGLCDVRVGGTDESYRYDIVDINTYRVRVTQNSGAYLAYAWFDAANDNWKMHINATPSATDTIYYSYYWEPPTRTATTDYVTCPNPMIIAKLALADIYEGEDEDEAAATAKNEAEQLIAEVIGVDNAPAVNQVVVMAGNVGKGIGTY
jgi:hypothetical protein